MNGLIQMNRCFKKLWQIKRIWLFVIAVILSVLLWGGMKTFGQSTTSSDLFHKYPRTTGTFISQKDRVSEIARQVSVRIITDPGLGSGVIINQQGENYTVLTCRHVVENSYYYKYSVLTFDNQVHNAFWVRSITFPNLDLALVKFKSKRAYPVAQIESPAQINLNELVYATGFPNWYWENADSPLSTKNWGNKAYLFTTGQLKMLLDQSQSLEDGYRLGYSNEVESGMSGGPVFNQYGRLIGINGRLRYPLLGIEAFELSDGTTPTLELFRQMESLSWAIPISDFQRQSINNTK